jgi:dihydroorotate dehydrogenase
MMYSSIIRPVLFLVSPERVHHWVVGLLKLVFAIPGIAYVVRRYSTVNDKRLQRNLFGLRFENPVGIAAGFDKNAHVFAELANFGFSHIEVGTVTPKAQPGNPKPRLFRLKNDQALINRMGFNNNGLEAMANRLREWRNKQYSSDFIRPIIGGNIGKNTLTPNSEAVEDYVANFKGLFEHVDYFVVNVSCPNISDLKELQDQDALLNILNRIQEINHSKPVSRPVLLKVSPDLNNRQLDEIIQIVKETGIDGVVATNTSITRHTLTKDQLKAQEIGQGGLSGKPLRDRSTEVIRYLAEKSGKAFPIIGVGGIMTPEDAIEKLEAGADLVQIYTGFIYSGPFLARKINKMILKKL